MVMRADEGFTVIRLVFYFRIPLCSTCIFANVDVLATCMAACGSPLPAGGGGAVDGLGAGGTACETPYLYTLWCGPSCLDVIGAGGARSDT